MTGDEYLERYMRRLLVEGRYIVRFDDPFGPLLIPQQLPTDNLARLN